VIFYATQAKDDLLGLQLNT